MNVLVYSGQDTSSASFTQTLSSLRTLLVPNYAVQTVSAQSLASHPWSTSCALLVLPSFRPQSVGLTSQAVKGIQSYLSQGGRLLAIGTGVRVHRPGTISSLSSSALALTARLAGIALSDPYNQGPSPASLTLDDRDSGLTFALTGSTEEREQGSADTDTVDVRLAEGGSTVAGLSRAGKVDLSQIQDTDLASHGVKPLAHLVASEEEAGQEIAGLKARIGRGSAVFWTVQVAGGVANERSGLQLLRNALVELGIALSPHDGGSARPLPQLLSAAPWRTAVVEDILRALAIPDLAEPFELTDSNDSFKLHPHADGERVLRSQREAIVNGSTSADPTTWNPKHIVVYQGGEVPPPELTPRFNIQTYYEELQRARKERGCPDEYKGAERWGMGEALLYGEVVTSTQTMLDKNTRLLTSLPTPVVSLASQQLVGRGRGTNVWLSPPGCLQFSILLRVPLTVLPATKVVFVQYLIALAVTEACRTVLGPLGAPGYSEGADTVPVRIKWPNDLYAVTRDGEKKKIGGILVNTNFGAGTVDFVVGCGVNVLNPPPIISLAQLLPDGVPAPTMERTLAAILARFERLWAEFLAARGDFAPFLDLYLDRWLHSDQLVTLTTVDPPREVRIVGITPDHGLLRTLPERAALADGGEVNYIDLQPDGNSFDLMAGLIKTKT